MSKQSDFVKSYAERSKETILGLFVLGYRSFPCDCNEDDCEGFQMLQGDARATYELAEMLGKHSMELTADELRTAHGVADSQRQGD